jgi:hypothetical protein
MARITGLFYRILGICEYLTFWAKMRPTLTHNDALDFRPANRAGLTLPAVDPKMILKVAAAVNPVNAGAVSTDAFLKHLADGHPKARSFFLAHPVRACQRVETGQVQRFIGINVTQTGQEGLVEQ